ncbi:hypothetical protein SAMN06265375_1011198 [Muriicola jejuensis]|nr:hypothetical protein SAMN06265375_1011198 [Muriicola jejuensis]
MTYSDPLSKTEKRSASKNMGLYQVIKRYAKKCRYSYLSLLSL